MSLFYDVTVLKILSLIIDAYVSTHGYTTSLTEAQKLLQDLFELKKKEFDN